MKDLNRYIQYTNVSANLTRDSLIAHCEECLEYGFEAAMIAPCWVPLAREILQGSQSHVATAFSFPAGNDSPAMKAVLAREVIKAGAFDFDFPAQTGFLLSGMEKDFFDELKTVADIASAEGARTKVILEFSLLPDEEIRRKAAMLADEAGIDFVKQSSGGKNSVPARPEDIRFLKGVLS
jgi:deoxyribose-phosphate aldolase